ncbi:hypothetical protein Vadar_012767 [Vaccinium darrowii]|uniref:Uncharacterized protein n=1 Tax=Vaccinium darrowii TaxID=229202 RepID=A0ACB7ZJ53_9ERIC|nr:hypothetical protein Vadar_012767 [Vaccinium darrowii]
MRYNEISHFSHPQHKLKFEYTEALFKCDGCNEVGIGSRYRCATCDYDLHLHCALLSPSFTHPFYTKCSFQFYSRPPGTVERYCNACEKDVTGFMYHCKSCGFDLHPCCAKLPVVLDDGDVKLYLYRKVSASCHRCGRKGQSWSYRSSCKKYNLHVACVKEMLVESWHDHQINMSNSHIGRAVNNNFNGGGKLETRIPKGTLQSYQKRSGNKGKMKKCSEMAGLAIQFVVSAVLGDPTTLIAGVVGSLISK